ncbi:unnamed protein product [Tuber melanosporum]|uniref:(Perigord truffle) hypothetical protein n=1 Tax=Tuber melanosporum (strain Mel28) TaxID=656061 RepID=D5G8E3_TUBMM|nr:uncharacterized protein GSTUM_00004778001 [Tuber melanosporum]CAZ80786.1 unnamed protein product [Tuber melanosporum]
MADTEETGDEDDAWISVNKGKGKERETETNGCVPTSRAANKGVKMVIGGWKSTPELAHEEKNTATVRKTIGKIGMVGERKMGQGENMIEDGKGAPYGSASRVPTPPLISPEESVKAAEEEEDEDEKADRKRRELQKELEAKKKVPVKKKRKF